MTHLERFFAAPHVSEGWYSAWLMRPNRLYAKARAMVVYDRIMCDETLGQKP